MGASKGLNKERVFGVAAFAGGIIHFVFWEFIRAAVYERVLHMLNPYITTDAMLHYGGALALCALGAWLIWHTRPKAVSKTAERNTEAEGRHAAHGADQTKKLEDLYVADPEAEALDKDAYNQLVAFCIDHLLPTCDAQAKMQEAIIRHVCSNETIASLAIDGLRNDWRYKTREFWENYTKLSSGLGDSPGPSIRFEGMIECVHELEKEFYKNFCDQGIQSAQSAGLDLGAVYAEWQGWLFKHNQMTNEYPKLSRDIRFGKLHRLRPSRWGSYS